MTIINEFMGDEGLCKCSKAVYLTLPTFSIPHHADVIVVCEDCADQEHLKTLKIVDLTTQEEE